MLVGVISVTLFFSATFTSISVKLKEAKGNLNNLQGLRVEQLWETKKMRVFSQTHKSLFVPLRLILKFLLLCYRVSFVSRPETFRYHTLLLMVTTLRLFFACFISLPLLDPLPSLLPDSPSGPVEPVLLLFSTEQTLTLPKKKKIHTQTSTLFSVVHVVCHVQCLAFLSVACLGANVFI